MSDHSARVVVPAFRRNGTLRFAVILVGLIAGCAGAPSAPTGNSADPPPTSPSKAYGRAFLAEAFQTYHFVLDPDVNGPVQRAGERLVRAINADPTTIHFFVIDEPQPNAFAIPGGYIFVFTGLLTKLAGEDELAGVLAHELGHVTHDHFFEDRKQIMALNLASLAALLLSGGHPAALAFPLGAGYHLQLAYSREHESAADGAAITYLRQAGYDPGALGRFFEALEVYERFNPPMVPAYFTTHPGVADRLRMVQTMAGNGSAATSRPPTADWGRVRAALGVVPTALPSTARTAYLTGIDHLKHDRLEAAIAAFHTALTERPDHALARADLALALLKSGQLDQARAEAVRSLADDPEQSTPSVVLGILAQEEGDHRAAVERFEAALAREPRDPTTHLRLARSFAALGEEPQEVFHLARYHQLNLEPAAAVREYQRLIAMRADPELRREARSALALLRREGT